MNKLSDFKEKVLSQRKDTSLYEIYKDDPEILKILNKYKTDTLNPIKNRTNLKKKNQEIESLLAKREEAKRTADRVDTLLRMARILIPVILVVVIGTFIINFVTTSVREISFVSEDEIANIGDDIDFSYIVSPSSAVYNTDDVIIETDNNNIKNIDGKWVATSEGNTQVKIIYKGKEKDSKTIEVKSVLIESISQQDIILGIGNTIQINPIIKLYNATNKKYALKTNNEEIVSVVNNELYGLNYGETYIDIVAEDGATKQFKVCVEDIIPQVIKLSGIKDEYLIEKSGQVELEFLPQETTDRNVNIYSTNSKVLQIDEDGFFKTIDAGEAKVVVRYSEDLIVEKLIKVSYPKATELKLTTSKNTLYVGDKTKLNVVLEPSKNSNEIFEYASSNESVASVDSSGVVTAKSEGKATITLLTDNGINDSIKFEIKEKQYIPIAAGTESRTGSGNRAGTVAGAETSSSVQAYTWIINTSNNKFHYQWCHSLPTTNRGEVTATRAEMDAMGYIPCGKCKP